VKVHIPNVKNQADAIVAALNNGEVLEALKRQFDRSFVVMVEDIGGKVKISFEEQDSGNNVMTVADVAAFLQTDRASVRRMTGDRAQHRSHHPIPFVKIGGKMIRFSRPAIEAWWNELCASKNGKSNMSALTLTKGKVKKR
jgi:predicted DNA-binding transcriptional regulator AlpA